MPKYARQPAGKNSHRRTTPNSHRAAIAPSRSGIPKPRRAEPRIQNQTHFLARRAAVALLADFKTKPNRPTTVPGDSSQFITFHYNFGFTPVAFAVMARSEPRLLPQSQNL